MGQTGFQNLQVREASKNLVCKIYPLFIAFPSKEFSLIDQMKRSAVSISSNIAEGSQRGSAKEFIRFLYIAKGSCAELESQSILAHTLGFISKENLDLLQKDIVSISKMLSSLIIYKSKTLTSQSPNIPTP